MPDEGKKPLRRSADPGRREKKLWIFLPILLVFVSITSFLAGVRIGRDTEYHLGQMKDTIILSPEGEKVDENHIDFSGQIHNPDGTPCVGQLVELHSAPMRTRTDSDGFFYFAGVEVGDHHLILLDERGETVSQIAVRIERDSTISQGVVEHSEQSVHLGVSDRAVGFHIHIHLDEENRMYVEPEIYTRNAGDTFRDPAGNAVSVKEKSGNREPESPVPESGEGLVDQDHIQEEKQEETRQDSSQDESRESFPAAEETTMGAPVESRPGETQGSGGGASGGAGSAPSKPGEPTDPLDVSVQEKGGPVWTQNTRISLFADRTGAGIDRKLMPGSKGTYGFYVSNRNDYPITYRMKISAPEGQLLLPLRYRLKSEGKYLCGDSRTWLTAEQLATALIKQGAGMEKEYLLEWQWLFDGGDDAYDTRIGTSDNLEYQVIVTIIIEQV